MFLLKAAEPVSTFPVWTATIIAALIAFTGVITAQILSQYLTNRYSRKNSLRERKIRVFFDMKGLFVTLPQAKMIVYESEVLAKYNDYAWRNDPEKRTTNQEQAEYHQKKGDDAIITAMLEIKTFMEKLAEIRLLFQHNPTILEYVHENQSRPFFMNHKTGVVAGSDENLNQQRDSLLDKYNEIVRREQSSMSKLIDAIEAELLKQKIN